MRERQRNRQRERETEDRDKERETEDRDKERERQIERERDRRQRQRERERQIYRERDRDKERERDRETDRQRERQRHISPGAEPEWRNPAVGNRGAATSPAWQGAVAFWDIHSYHHALSDEATTTSVSERSDRRYRQSPVFVRLRLQNVSPRLCNHRVCLSPGANATRLWIKVWL